MRRLPADPDEARRLGEGARQIARARFSIERFARDWDDALRLVTSTERRRSPVAGGRIGGGA
jgi:hypothetical protein